MKIIQTLLRGIAGISAKALSHPVWTGIGVIVSVILAFVPSWWASITREPGLGESKLPSLHVQMASSVGLVYTDSIPFYQGARGSAFAISPNMAVTAGHVGRYVNELLHEKKPAKLVWNRGNGRSSRVRKVMFHPEYGKRQPLKAWIDQADVCVLLLEEAAPYHVRIADNTELQTMDLGTEVYVIGYRIESKIDLLRDKEFVNADFIKSVISDISDPQKGYGKWDHLVMLSCPLVGDGAMSGAPVFSMAGHVVGLAISGDFSTTVDQEGRRQRHASPSGQSYFLRIDALTQVPLP